MAGRKQSRGICSFCNHETTKGSMSKHLKSCQHRLDQVAEANSSKRKPEMLYHLRVQDAYNPEFWLDLEIKGSAALKDIDLYLRGIWLECCGHLSEFFPGKGGFMADNLAKSRKVDIVFQSISEITHIYDMGTSSETLLKMIDQREGTPLTRRAVVLMARNQMPAAVCQECGDPATHLCLECMYEEEIPTLCPAHAQSHPHQNYGEPIKLVNSPRLGMCGYDGPALAPY
jgi:hypothetical protein